ncbi:hypothetical protein [Spirosoma sp. KUDC1026]|uniref:hypothetical protein n=1 Tax=Spirosoma sp. KUDC1026 TaxID=2745947 RepID=UPI00159BCD17|nr:hypothetical protein [Spirosoma sp. KUDC1026]QKZ12731.1 hypothetical protein HU175_08840 [Spirosoma sp. KUDC1026]
MTPSCQPWTKSQLEAKLIQLDHLLNQNCFTRDALYEPATEAALIAILRLEEALLNQTELAGKRIDFLDEVGTNGRIEDITSLLQVINRHLYDFTGSTGANAEYKWLRVITPQINHFYGAGWGYFHSNGVVFSCSHEDELAFFVGPYRVFFFRHLVRAYQEARLYLTHVLPD